jgi:hypothetical protein
VHDDHNVRGRSATTIASFRTPSFSTTQRPMRGSRASAATISTGASLSFAFPRRAQSAAPFMPFVSGPRRARERGRGRAEQLERVDDARRGELAREREGAQRAVESPEPDCAIP